MKIKSTLNRKNEPEELDSRENPNFLDRDYSWLAFNRRILAEAKSEDNPVMERLKFLAIVQSNLDEFISVRGLRAKHGYYNLLHNRNIGIMKLLGEIDDITTKTHTHFEAKLPNEHNVAVRNIYHIMSRQSRNGNGLDSEEDRIFTTAFEYMDLVWEQYKMLDEIVKSNPMVNRRCLPFLESEKVYILIYFKNSDGDNMVCTVDIPEKLQHCFRGVVDTKDSKGMVRVTSILPIDQIIARHSKDIITAIEGWGDNSDIIDVLTLRVVRDKSMPLNEKCSKLTKDIKRVLKERKSGEILLARTTSEWAKIEIDPGLIDILCANIENFKDRHYHSKHGMANIKDLMKIYKLTFDNMSTSANLYFEPLAPLNALCVRDDTSIFDYIAQHHNVLLYHPYMSFNVVEKFIEEAAKDEDVVSIQQTIYRVGDVSRIVAALKEASRRGKIVTVVVEARARFDEQRNLSIGNVLKDAGCNVIYGVVGVKTHSKVCIVTRKEKVPGLPNSTAVQLKHYVHLSTGNYNGVTATQYTDIGLITDDRAIGEDAINFFNMLSGQVPKIVKLQKLIISPVNLKAKVINYISRETRIAKKGIGHNAEIFMKMNSLVDPDVINALYIASKAGVKITLIVRGICCLKAQVPRLSENITVRSITGRYLEHARVYMFGPYNSKRCKLFCSSADMMPRNLYRRNEIMFPIEDQFNKDFIKKNIIDIESDPMLRCWEQCGGKYYRVPPSLKQDKMVISQTNSLLNRYDDEGKSIEHLYK